MERFPVREMAEQVQQGATRRSRWATAIAAATGAVYGIYRLLRGDNNGVEVLSSLGDRMNDFGWTE